ncbi:hypothetical protein N7540_003501 [Penicillium herquei]|nr:hypothetical protein N7540_003501 [Penicillium herquei]
MVMAQFLRDPDVLQADVIAIQEPWKNPYQNTTHHPAKDTHELLWPDDGEERPRVCMFVSKKLAGWTHYAHSRDVQELRLKTVSVGEIRLFNVYNEDGVWGGLDMLKDVVPPVSERRGTPSIISYLVVGDFNLHHPAWGGDTACEDPRADDIIELMDLADLDLWLEPGTKTRMGSGDQSSTSIDLVLASRALEGRLISCDISLDNHADSDHLPIKTVLDVETDVVEDVRRRCWRSMDTEKFLNFVSANLETLNASNWPQDPTPATIDQRVNFLLETVQQGIQASTPWAKPSKWARIGWTDECSEAIKESRRLFRSWRDSKHSTFQCNDEFSEEYRQMLQEECHAAYRAARNHKGRVIAKASQQGFRSWVKKTTEEGPRGLWKVGKWARSRGDVFGVIPALKRTNGQLAESNEEKVSVLRDVFFPAPPIADLSDIPISSDPAMSRSQLPFPPITVQEINDVIRHAPPDKAPGPDAIPNRVWKLLLSGCSLFGDLLTSIFDACVRLGYNPRHFQESTTVTLRKGGPRDYRLPKSYRPIALMNTLGKLLEAVVATRISYAVEEHSLLPKTHLGGRKGISVDHAIQLILSEVREAWGTDKKVSMLLLDVSGAYDNVSHTRLLHNMRRLGLGHFALWTASFLADRRTRIRLPGYLSDIFPTSTGIPQGSPISPILFLLFNASLVRGCSLRGVDGDGTKTCGYGWVDDVAVIAVSSTYRRNVEMLQAALGQADTWARRHAAKFAPDKFELIHFTNPSLQVHHPITTGLLLSCQNNNINQTTSPITVDTPRVRHSMVQTIEIQGPDVYNPIRPPPGNDLLPVHTASGLVIQPSQSAKYLGIWLDKHLNFNTHRTKLVAKATGSLEALRGISGSTWGASLTAMRLVYQAVVVPQMLYGVAAWFSPAARLVPKVEESKMITAFTAIQRRAAILIAGAFKSMSAAALNVELYLMPVHLQMQQIIENTAIRIQTGPTWAQPALLQHCRTATARQRGGWSPIEVLRWKKGQILYLDGSSLGWETRKSFVLAPWEQRITCVIEDAEKARNSAEKAYPGVPDAPDAPDGSNKGFSAEKAAPFSAEKPCIFFTDGSGYEGHIGAAAIVPTELDSNLKRHLGRSDQSTVYLAELSGIEMALESFLARLQDPTAPRELAIFVDSQAAIQAVQNPKRPSGQFILSSIYSKFKAIQAQKPTKSLQKPSVTIHWVPAHVGILGNEIADLAAKEAAKDTVGVSSELSSGGPRLATTARRLVRDRVRARWTLEWSRERTGQPNRRLTEVPEKKNLKIFEGLPKHYTSILVQMRSMRIGLKHFLYKIKEADSDECGCGEGSQTPRHVLLQCPKYIDLRETLINKLMAKTDLRPSQLDYEAIMSHPQAARYVAEFMIQTGLLGQFRKCEVEPEPDTERDTGI